MKELADITERYLGFLVAPLVDGKRKVRKALELEAKVEFLCKGQIMDASNPYHGSWGDVTTNSDWKLAHGGNVFARIKTLAWGWAAEGTRYTRSEDLAERLRAAWRYFHQFVHPDCEFPLNWWSWQIGIPWHLSETYIMAKEVFSLDEQEQIVDTLKYLVDHIDKSMIGANGVWGALNYLRRSIITGEVEFLEKASEWVTRECMIRSVNGIMQDYTYSFHGNAVHMGYGSSQFHDVGLFIYLLGDSVWQISEEALTNFSNWLLEFVQWTIYKGAIDPFIIGREISRGDDVAKEDARLILDGALYASSIFLPRKDEILTFCSREIAEGLEPGTDLGVHLFKGAMPQQLVGNRYWDSIEYMVSRTQSYYCSVKMSSTKTKSWFSIWDENVQGWHTSDGQLVLKPKGDEYFGHVIPTQDWTRLTGITRADGFRMPREQLGHSPYVTGTVSDDGRFGCCGVDFLIRDEDDKELKAKKSYFFFEDFFIVLGSDIGCDRDVEVETIVRQVALPMELDDGYKASILELEGGMTGILGFDCAYMVPSEAEVDYSINTRSANWRSVSKRMMYHNDEVFTRTFELITLKHGKGARNGEYMVIYVPGSGVSMERLCEIQRSVVVVKKDSTAHVVKYLPDNVTMEVRWGESARVF